MIRKILTYYAEQLEEYLSRFHRRSEGLTMVSMIGNSTEERPNKIVVSLLNIEREVTEGIATPLQRTTNGGYVHRQSPLLLNLNIILAAVFDEHLYDESLSLLSDTLGFIQSTPKFEINRTGYTIEVMNFSTQDMNNVWTLLGGQYYPSVVCKIRRLTIDTNTVSGTGRTTDQPIVEM